MTPQSVLDEELADVLAWSAGRRRKPVTPPERVNGHDVGLAVFRRDKERQYDRLRRSFDGVPALDANDVPAADVAYDEWAVRARLLSVMPLESTVSLDDHAANIARVVMWARSRPRTVGLARPDVQGGQ